MPLEDDTNIECIGHDHIKRRIEYGRNFSETRYKIC